jgi:UDP-glucose 4-epimerase
MMKCLVTGGAGFIGSHLVEVLVQRGAQVRVLDNLSTGSLANLRLIGSEIDFIHDDLSSLARLRELLAGVEVVFHLATAPSHHLFATAPSLLRWLYDPGLAHLLIASCEAGVRRVIYASSCSVYGRAVAPRLRETDSLLPVTAHGLAKLVGEQHCIGFTALHGLETVRLRYFDTIGTRQSPEGSYARVIPELLRALLAGRSLALEADCFSYYDLIDVDDVVHATLAAATAPRVAGKAYNVARGQPVALAELIQTASDLLGRQLTAANEDLPACFPWPRAVDITRAAADLGFCPAIDLRRSLRRLLESTTWQAGLADAEALVAPLAVTGAPCLGLPCTPLPTPVPLSYPENRQGD